MDMRMQHQKTLEEPLFIQIQDILIFLGYDNFGIWVEHPGIIIKHTEDGLFLRMTLENYKSLTLN